MLRPTFKAHVPLTVRVIGQSAGKPESEQYKCTLELHLKAWKVAVRSLAAGASCSQVASSRQWTCGEAEFQEWFYPLSFNTAFNQG